MKTYFGPYKYIFFAWKSKTMSKWSTNSFQLRRDCRTCCRVRKSTAEPWVEPKSIENNQNLYFSVEGNKELWQASWLWIEQEHLSLTKGKNNVSDTWPTFLKNVVPRNQEIAYFYFNRAMDLEAPKLRKGRSGGSWPPKKFDPSTTFFFSLDCLSGSKLTRNKHIFFFPEFNAGGKNKQTKSSSYLKCLKLYYVEDVGGKSNLRCQSW